MKLPLFPAWTPRLKQWLQDCQRDPHLRPLALWSRGIIWAIAGFTVSFLVWLALAQTEEVISATGKLEPFGEVQEIQSPVAGVIERAFVEEGQHVKKGDPLLRLDQKVMAAQLASLEAVRASLRAEVDFLSAEMAMEEQQAEAGGKASADVPAEMVALARDRTNLLLENRIFRAQLSHSAEGVNLPAAQLAFFEAAEKDRDARIREADLGIEQVEAQIPINQSQLEQLDKLLQNSRKVLAGYTALLKDNAIGSMERLARETDAIRAEVEADKLRATIANLTVELRKSREARDAIDITYRKDALGGIEKNAQRIAEIDARLSKAVIDDRNRLAEIESQATQLRTTFAYHDLVAPIDGIIFDLRWHKPGTVVTASEQLLKIVPSEALVARVFLPNRDVGFARLGMSARVRVDSFPFREFGDIEGQLAYLGSDALPPSQAIPYYSFPARIDLVHSHLQVRGEPARLQSGMAVTVDLQVRKRRMLSILIDATFRPLEKLREMR